LPVNPAPAVVLAAAAGRAVPARRRSAACQLRHFLHRQQTHQSQTGAADPLANFRRHGGDNLDDWQQLLHGMLPWIAGGLKPLYRAAVPDLNCSFQATLSLFLVEEFPKRRPHLPGARAATLTASPANPHDAAAESVFSPPFTPAHSTFSGVAFYQA
jgi:hypothetical protein